MVAKVQTPLDQSLILCGYISSLLGDGDMADFKQTANTLARAAYARRPDGQSLFYDVLESRRDRLQLPLTKLQQYDQNVLAHEEAIARARRSNGRSEFEHLKYFQYLAALYTEIYLDLYTGGQLGGNAGRADLHLRLEEYRRRNFPKMDGYASDLSDLGKLAYWMATGAGKTLVMHINLRQFQHYQPFIPSNILLITPSVTLREQHIEELRASGFTAAYANDPTASKVDVQVMEISKLLNPKEQPQIGGKRRKGGVRVPTDEYQPPNLLLVDEGHKGSSSGSSDSEQAWRDIRNALTKDGGFTLEYSATFKQVTEKDESLLKEYRRTILYEYSYRHFFGDGYGKQPLVTNIDKKADLYGDPLLLAGLLTFYEQYLYYANNSGELAPYNLTTPLMVFVGAQVNAGKQADKSEVLQVVRFLDRVLRQPDWAADEIAKLLDGSSRVYEAGFKHNYPYLNEFYRREGAALNAETVYRDLRGQLFHGAGQLQLRLLQSSGTDGEIGLRLSDTLEYCGVVNVGDAPNFLKLAEKPNDGGQPLAVELPDHLTSSLFKSITEDTTMRVNFLVGSKKFIEGWSSWRVSVMGLLNVGSTAGAQVLQLFGRGVRLKGFNLSLRRSRNLERDGVIVATRPPHIDLLESLFIFGLRANYLATFRDTLEKEGVQTEEPPASLSLQIKLLPDLEQQGLQVIRPRPDFDFHAQTLAFNPQSNELDITPTDLSLSKGAFVPQPFPAAALDFDELYYHALNLKQQPDESGQAAMPNLYITRRHIAAFFDKFVRVIAPQEVLDLRQPEHRTALREAARERLTEGLKAYYYRQRRRAETLAMQAVPLIVSGNKNFPAESSGGTVTYRYTLSGPPSAIAAVKQLIKSGAIANTDFHKPLPRFYVDEHLYNPLLPKERFNTHPLYRDDYRNEINNGVVEQGELTIIPTGLVESEGLFVLDLAAWWQQHKDTPEWASYDVYLLRNQANSGIGFQFDARDGFYPDFLLWLKRGSEQVLAFVDPKGLGKSFDQNKVDMTKSIAGLSSTVGMPILAYIVTNSKLAEITKLDISRNEERLREMNILLQRPTSAHNPTDAYAYVDYIVNEMRKQLDKAAE